MRVQPLQDASANPGLPGFARFWGQVLSRSVREGQSRPAGQDPGPEAETFLQESRVRQASPIPAKELLRESAVSPTLACRKVPRAPVAKGSGEPLNSCLGNLRGAGGMRSVSSSMKAAQYLKPVSSNCLIASSSRLANSGTDRRNPLAMADTFLQESVVDVVESEKLEEGVAMQPPR